MMYSMEIFHGDTAKIDRLNEILVKKAGFPSCYLISTQSRFTSNTLDAP
jgi:adenylosuccinate lyase